MALNKARNSTLTPQILLPPENFFIVDENLYRANSPLNRQHLSFLCQLNIRLSQLNQT